MVDSSKSFIYGSLIYLLFSLIFFIKDWYQFSNKTFLKIEDGVLFFNSEIIDKSEIAEIKFHTRNKQRSYGGTILVYPIHEVEKKYTLVIYLKDKMIDIDLNNIFLEDSPKENYQKIKKALSI